MNELIGEWVRSLSIERKWGGFHFRCSVICDCELILPMLKSYFFTCSSLLNLSVFVPWSRCCVLSLLVCVTEFELHNSMVCCSPPRFSMWFWGMWKVWLRLLFLFQMCIDDRNVLVMWLIRYWLCGCLCWIKACGSLALDSWFELW